MDQCYLDCVNHIYNDTYGCIPIVNIDNSWIRLERDLNYFGFKYCEKMLKFKIFSKSFHTKCMQQCPSPCTIPMFKVNHYVKDNSENQTILNLIPKYNIEVSFIESYKMSFYDLMYELGGIVGLWLGLSFLSLLDLFFIIMRFINKIINYIDKFKKYLVGIFLKLCSKLYRIWQNYRPSTLILEKSRLFHHRKAPKSRIEINNKKSSGKCNNSPISVEQDVTLEDDLTVQDDFTL